MDVTNIYKTIKDLKVDRSVEGGETNYIILQPHQIIPKYYIFSDDSRHALILNYSTGSGKTISGLFCIINQLRLAKIFNIYKNMRVQKAIIVGEWMTHNQFSYDMSRPLFGLTNNKFNVMYKAAKTREEKDEVLQKVSQSMSKLVGFFGYQSLFNALFPYYYSQRIQDINVLIYDFQHDKLQVNTDFLEMLRNNILIVDEMQKLYNQHGLNTYGFSFAYLIKVASELNLKIVYMSGTIFNTSVSEISAILNLIYEKKQFFTINDFCKTEAFETLSTYKLIPNKIDEIISIMKPVYIYFSRTQVKTTSTVYTKSEFKKAFPKVYVFDEIDEKNVNTTSKGHKLVNMGILTPHSETGKTNDENVRDEEGNDENTNDESVDVENTHCNETSTSNVRNENTHNGESNVPNVRYGESNVPDVRNENVHNGESNVPNVSTPNVCNDESNAPSVDVSNTNASSAHTPTTTSPSVNALSQSNVYSSKLSLTSACKYVVIRSEEVNYPTEIRVGNTLLDDNFNLMKLNAEGYQLKAMINTSKSLDSDDEDNDKLSVFDAGFPPMSEWKKNGIHVDGDNLYTGEFLQYENIGKFSAVGKFIIKLCLNNAFNNEKTILYHNKLSNFGLLQYGKILEENGFVRRGFDVTNTSVCRLCHHTYEKHMKSCPHFEPMYFEFLHGAQKPSERQYITNQIYNHPNNLYGELISVLLISDVAYAGVSFMNTNNLAILTRVPNISKVAQIMARIVRFKSHLSLPDNRKFAKFYILGVSDGTGYIESYYKMRILNQQNIDKFIKTLVPKSVGYMLLNNPTDYVFTKNEQKRIASLVYDDGKEILENITDVLVKSVHLNFWSLDRLTERIRSKQIAISYLDLSIFPKEFIQYYVLQNPNFETFKFADDNQYYIRNKGFSNTNEIVNNKKIMFENIKAEYNEAIEDYKQMIEFSKSTVKQRQFFIKLMELLTTLNDYSPLVKWKYFWDVFVFWNASEYYENDETNFLSNHSTKHRSVNKIKGTYWQNRIILKDGSYKSIEKTFVNSNELQDLHMVFHIEPTVGLKIIFFQTHKEVTDDIRFNQRGKDCWISVNKDITHYYKIKSKSPIEKCADLLPKLCDGQLANNKEKFVVTPFEKDMRF